MVGIFPYNKRMAAGITDAAELQDVLAKWRRVNTLRASIWAVQWAAITAWWIVYARRQDRLLFREVLLVADQRPPGGVAAVVGDLLHGQVGHEGRRAGAVPVDLARVEADRVPRSQRLDRLAADLEQPEALGDVDPAARTGARARRCARRA